MYTLRSTVNMATWNMVQWRAPEAAISAGTQISENRTVELNLNTATLYTHMDNVYMSQRL
jgi:hypothetical protein